MISLRHLALFAIAAGTMAAAHAQSGDGDAARRMRNREEAMTRYQQMQRGGPGGAPMAAPAAMHDHRHHHGHHKHHHMHRHPHHAR